MTVEEIGRRAEEVGQRAERFGKVMEEKANKLNNRNAGTVNGQRDRVPGRSSPSPPDGALDIGRMTRLQEAERQMELAFRLNGAPISRCAEMSKGPSPSLRLKKVSTLKDLATIPILLSHSSAAGPTKLELTNSFLTVPILEELSRCLNSAGNNRVETIEIIRCSVQTDGIEHNEDLLTSLFSSSSHNDKTLTIVKSSLDGCTAKLIAHSLQHCKPLKSFTFIKNCLTEAGLRLIVKSAENMEKGVQLKLLKNAVNDSIEGYSPHIVKMDSLTSLLSTVGEEVGEYFAGDWMKGFSGWFGPNQKPQSTSQDEPETPVEASVQGQPKDLPKVEAVDVQEVTSTTMETGVARTKQHVTVAAAAPSRDAPDISEPPKIKFDVNEKAQKHSSDATIYTHNQSSMQSLSRDPPLTAPWTKHHPRSRPPPTPPTAPTPPQPPPPPHFPISHFAPYVTGTAHPRPLHARRASSARRAVAIGAEVTGTGGQPIRVIASDAPATVEEEEKESPIHGQESEELGSPSHLRHGEPWRHGHHHVSHPGKGSRWYRHGRGGFGRSLSAVPASDEVHLYPPHPFSGHSSSLPLPPPPVPEASAPDHYKHFWGHNPFYGPPVKGSGRSSRKGRRERAKSLDTSESSSSSLVTEEEESSKSDTSFSEDEKGESSRMWKRGHPQHGKKADWKGILPDEWSALHVYRWLVWLGYPAAVTKEFLTQKIDGSLLPEVLDMDILEDEMGCTTELLRRSVQAAIHLALHCQETRELWKTDGGRGEERFWNCRQVRSSLAEHVDHSLKAKLREKFIVGALLCKMEECDANLLLQGLKTVPRKRGLRYLSTFVPVAASMLQQSASSSKTKLKKAGKTVGESSVTIVSGASAGLGNDKQSRGQSTYISDILGRSQQPSSDTGGEVKRQNGGPDSAAKASVGPPSAPPTSRAPSTPLSVGAQLDTESPSTAGIVDGDIPVIEVFAEEARQLSNPYLPTAVALEASTEEDSYLLAGRYRVLPCAMPPKGRCLIADGVDTWSRKQNKVKLKFYTQEDEDKARNELRVLDDVGSEFCVEALSDLIEKFDDRGSFCIVLEAGTLDLDMICRHHTLTVNEIRSVMEKVGLCLYALHRKKYVHNDLKLQNIVDFSKGRIIAPKLIDLEEATKVHQPISCNMTTEYCPPEVAVYLMTQQRGSGDQRTQFLADYSLDVWCFGMSLLRMFNGGETIPEFVSREKEEIIAALASPHFTIGLHWVGDRGARELIGQCLCLDPTQRPSMGKVLRHPFFAGYNTTLHEKVQIGSFVASGLGRQLYEEQAEKQARNTSEETKAGSVEGESKSDTYCKEEVADEVAVEGESPGIKSDLSFDETSSLMRTTLELAEAAVPGLWLVCPYEVVTDKKRVDNILHKLDRAIPKKLVLYFLCEAGDRSVPCDAYSNPLVLSKAGDLLQRGAPMFIYTLLFIKIAEAAGESIDGLPPREHIPFIGSLAAKDASRFLDELLAVFGVGNIVDKSQLSPSHSQHAELLADIWTLIQSIEQDEEQSEAKRKRTRVLSLLESYRNNAVTADVYAALKEMLSLLQINWQTGVIGALERIVFSEAQGGGVRWVCRNHAKALQDSAE